MKTWEECTKENIITQTNPDIERSNKILEMADLRLEFWNKKIDNKFVTLKIEAYYDIIKELIFAHLYKNGFNCTNHSCLIAYIKEKLQDFEYETKKLDELRKVRNEISYKGFSINKDYLERNELEFKNIIKRLKEEIKQ